MADLFSNPTISALVGVVVGGLISYVAGVGLARRQRRDTHRAAVRAVVYELTENLPKVMNTGSIASRLSTSTVVVFKSLTTGHIGCSVTGNVVSPRLQR